MKKVVLLITILFVSVLTTACINNLAVQELNNKAKEYLNNGDTEAAICRLKSSLDLDSNMYETHYNLAIAYIADKKYNDAIGSLQTALKLNPELVDAYYSLGVANEESAFNIINGTPEETEKDEQPEQPEQIVPKKLTEADKKVICDKLTEAIENYNQYLSKKVDAQDKDKVNERINYLNSELKKYNLSDGATTQVN